jgi:hypothetical protein
MSTKKLDIFTPYRYDSLSKKRIGSKYDGGYVISTDVEPNYGLILSGGAGNNISFEEQLSTLYNIKCAIYDHSVNIKTKNTHIHHIKERLNKNCSTFFDLINKYNNIFLKLDIEGGEYEVLSCLSENQIKNFKQIVIELHNCYTEQSLDIVKKLFIHHTLIHIHGNNCCQLIDFHNIKVPPVIELTLVRNSEIKNEIKKNTQPIPTELDFPNLKNRPDIQLNYYPFVAND